MHEHIKALLKFKIAKGLEAMQLRGVGYIDCEYTDGIDYQIDDTVYEITIKEKKQGAIVPPHKKPTK